MRTLARVDGESAYRWLSRMLRAGIEDGSFTTDVPLPTEMWLAREHDLSRQTVRRAFQELVAEGLVYRVPGRGTFVRSPEQRYGRVVASVDDLLALPHDTDFDLVRPLGGNYDAGAAEALQLTVRQHYTVSFHRRHRGQVFCWTRVHLPSGIGISLESCPELTDPSVASTATVIGLIEALGHTIDGADQSITAVAAGVEHAANLPCSVGDPLLHIERTYYDPAGNPLEHAVSDYLPSLYAHTQRLGRTATEIHP